MSATAIEMYVYVVLKTIMEIEQSYLERSTEGIKMYVIKTD